jgi:hypothetical protein
MINEKSLSLLSLLHGRSNRIEFPVQRSTYLKYYPTRRARCHYRFLCAYVHTCIYDGSPFRYGAPPLSLSRTLIRPALASFLGNRRTSFDAEPLRCYKNMRYQSSRLFPVLYSPSPSNPKHPNTLLDLNISQNGPTLGARVRASPQRAHHYYCFFPRAAPRVQNRARNRPGPRAHRAVPCGVGRRPGQTPRQLWLPCPVQLDTRALQGWSQVTPQR